MTRILSIKISTPIFECILAMGTVFVRVFCYYFEDTYNADIKS